MFGGVVAAVVDSVAFVVGLKFDNVVAVVVGNLDQYLKDHVVSGYLYKVPRL